MRLSIKIFVGIIAFMIYGVLLASQLHIMQAYGVIERIAVPGWNSCYRCHRPWNKVQRHRTVIDYFPKGSRDNSCDPLCQWCWGQLTPQQRLPFYRKLWQDWYNNDSKQGFQHLAPNEHNQRWEVIKKAVLLGGYIELTCQDK